MVMNRNTKQVVDYLSTLVKRVELVADGVILRLEKHEIFEYFNRHSLSWKKPVFSGCFCYPEVIGTQFRTMDTITAYIRELCLTKYMSIYLRTVPGNEDYGELAVQDFAVYRDFGLYLIKNP